MARPLSMDIRERAMARLAAGQTVREVALALRIGASSVVKWSARQRQHGSVAPNRMGGHRPRAITGKYREMVLETIATKPHVSLRELTSLLEKAGLKVHHASVGRFLKRERQSYKKTLMASEQERPKVARRREQWRKYQSRIDGRRLVFIDETWVKTNMAPLRGWGPRGSRLIGHAPYGHWRTMTFLAALRHDRIEAPWVVNGPINAKAFHTYVETQLIRTLQPDDVVVVDNLGSHKGEAVRRAIRAAGARLFFLPPYSPDLNPIEKTFSKIKQAMRKAMGRSIDEVHDALAAVLDTIAPTECSNYFKQAGYNPT
ncbi:MAG: IS630 family transposase [Rhodospirillaceae bacterium]